MTDEPLNEEEKSLLSSALRHYTDHLFRWREKFDPLSQQHPFDAYTRALELTDVVREKLLGD